MPSTGVLLTLTHACQLKNAMCLQLIKQLHAQLSTVAVIVTGSHTSRPSAVSALQAGAADYMRKPVDHDELIARIERHVQRQVR